MGPGRDVLAGYVNSKHQDVAVDVINFLVNDPEAGKILGTDRGLPPTWTSAPAVQNSVTDPNMKATVDFENACSEVRRGAERAAEGAVRIRTLVTRRPRRSSTDS